VYDHWPTVCNLSAVVPTGTLKLVPCWAAVYTDNRPVCLCPCRLYPGIGLYIQQPAISTCCCMIQHDTAACLWLSSKLTTQMEAIMCRRRQSPGCVADSDTGLPCSCVRLDLSYSWLSNSVHDLCSRSWMPNTDECIQYSCTDSNWLYICRHITEKTMNSINRCRLEHVSLRYLVTVWHWLSTFPQTLHSIHIR